MPSSNVVRTATRTRQAGMRSKWSRPGPAAVTLSGRITRVPAAVSYMSPLSSLSPDAQEEYRLGCCSGPWQRAFRDHGDRVAGLRGFFRLAHRRGAGKRGRSATGSLSTPATACRFLGQASRDGVRSSAWVHSPGPTNRHFSQDELAMSASTVLWLRLTLHVPNPAPGGRDALVLMPDDTSHDRKEHS
jgi:hypothetical protein